MSESILYHGGSRRLQDEFESRRIADRLEKKLTRTAFTQDDKAFIDRNDPLVAETVGAQLIVRVKALAIFPNCPRYIPTMQLLEPSIYVPRPGCEPVEPAWKGFADFEDYMRPRQKTARGEAE
jgi:hypothetical protein